VFDPNTVAAAGLDYIGIGRRRARLSQAPTMVPK
jgi:hypothetical protein